MSAHHNKTSIRSPLARARGLGSAGHGSGHWLAQRVTAVAAIPLCLWLVYSIVALRGASHTVLIDWLASPVNAVSMILFVITVFYHAALGLQVVIEDYVHCECVKLPSIIGMKLALFALAVVSVFSVLKVAL